jgi:hypothetical protein
MSVFHLGLSKHQRRRIKTNAADEIKFLLFSLWMALVQWFSIFWRAVRRSRCEEHHAGFCVESLPFANTHSIAAAAAAWRGY